MVFTVLQIGKLAYRMQVFRLSAVFWCPEIVLEKGWLDTTFRRHIQLFHDLVKTQVFQPTLIQRQVLLKVQVFKKSMVVVSICG